MKSIVNINIIIVFVVAWPRQSERMETDPLWHISQSLPSQQWSALPFNNVGYTSPRGDPGGAGDGGGGGR